MSIASRALSNYNWSHVIDKNNCPQAAYTNFDCTLNSLVDIYFPLTTKNFNSNFHKIEPWMTVGILTSHHRKNFLFSEKLIKIVWTDFDPLKNFDFVNWVKTLFTKVLKNLNMSTLIEERIFEGGIELQEKNY